MCGGATGKDSDQVNKFGGMGSGNHQGRVNDANLVNREHRFGPTLQRAGWVGIELRKGTTRTASISVPRESCLDPCCSNPLSEASQFSSSLYVPDTFPSAAFVLELRANEVVN